MRTTPTSTAANTDEDNNYDEIGDGDNEDEHYLHKMLKNAEQALELTDKNMNILQNCIDSMDMFKDKLDGDILEFGDEIRKTFQEFPFKTIIPSYHQKILEEELRLNRMLAKYPDLAETEETIYKIQANYESQYRIPSNNDDAASQMTQFSPGVV
eukprot:CAMPEP_0201577782 /NCGR_PEP_ID=MMETSP0190_2-20130828/24297_1 /ASSEMBLY_ACC=CAM_ASM_000263 /TAXON_ID=37353 /ORGANISM="Rosalina sp." /LENGTH=154 /DNA_ID=CAMNT_0048010169 /DNA_START=72 /DNA_END=532 /DNA_ORIENTATION=-